MQTRGVELAKKIFKVVDSFHVDGILRLDKFTAYFGDWLPPWSSTEHVRLELALEVVAQFQALADRLGDIKHHRFEDDFPEKVSLPIPLGPALDVQPLVDTQLSL